MKFSIAITLAAALSFRASAFPTSEVEVSEPLSPLLPRDILKPSWSKTRAAETCGYATVPLLRAYSAHATDHFYTTNTGEMETAVASLGYTSEGDAAQVLPSQAPNTVPLYRMYSPGATDHFYTTNAAERNKAISSLGYVNEGITAYVYPSNL